MINFTPEGLGGKFFGVLAPYAPPPPPRALPPVMWGSEDHVRGLFGDRVDALELTRREYVQTAPTPRDYRELSRRPSDPRSPSMQALPVGRTVPRPSTASSSSLPRGRTEARPTARRSTTMSICWWWLASAGESDSRKLRQFVGVTRRVVVIR
jgi:hypothetical protein